MAEPLDLEMIDPQEAGQTLDTAGLEVKPYGEIESWTRGKLADVLKVEAGHVDVHRRFSEFGVDSIVATALAAEMTEWIGLELPPTLFWDYPTISSMSRHIDEQLRHRVYVKQSNSGAVLLKDNSAERNLFCICGVGVYQDFADQFLDEPNVYGVYIPPEGSPGEFRKAINEACKFATLEDLARSYCETIVSSQGDGPYYLLGVSFGGVIGFEVAQQLKRRGADVPLIVLVDSILPIAVRPSMHRRVVRFIRTKARSLKSEFRRRKEGNSDDLSFDEVRRSRRGYYWGLAKRYVPVVYDSSVVLFRAGEEDLFGPGSVIEDDLGWKNLVSGRLERIDIAGTHMGLLKKPHVVTVAAVTYSRINGFAG